MKPKFTTLLCLCFLCGVFHTARAEDSYRSVIVTTASDEIIKFDLSGGVDVVFSDTDMIITATSNQVTLPLTDFARFDFSTESASVGQNNICNAVLRVSDGFISLSGLSPKSPVTLSTIGGILIHNGLCDDSGCFSSQSLMPGIYILKTNISTLKISIKQ